MSMTQMIARRLPEERNVPDDCPKRGLLNNPGESRLRLEGRSDDGPEKWPRTDEEESS